jgi:hypothetical protein
MLFALYCDFQECNPDFRERLNKIAGDLIVSFFF